MKDMNLYDSPSQPKQIKTEKEYQPYNKNKNPTEFKVGDVLMHPVFKHPYVLLKDKGDFWICGFHQSKING
jgi:hypothetical protein